MAQRLVATEVNANGQLRLPKPVRQALHLSSRGGTVGFVIDGKRVVLTKAVVVPEPTLSNEEIAFLARLSKQGAGKRTFRSADAALRYLWGL